MRVAVLILGLVFTVAIFVTGFLGLAMRGMLAQDTDPAAVGLAGGGALLLVALLYLIGSAFSLGHPRFAALVFLIASFVSFTRFVDGVMLGHPVWALVALVLAVLSFFGRGETRRQRPAGNPAP